MKGLRFFLWVGIVFSALSGLGFCAFLALAITQHQCEYWGDWGGTGEGLRRGWGSSCHLLCWGQTAGVSLCVPALMGHPKKKWDCLNSIIKPAKNMGISSFPWQNFSKPRKFPHFHDKATQKKLGLPQFNDNPPKKTLEISSSFPTPQTFPHRSHCSPSGLEFPPNPYFILFIFNFPHFWQP